MKGAKETVTLVLDELRTADRMLMLTLPLVQLYSSYVCYIFFRKYGIQCLLGVWGGLAYVPLQSIIRCPPEFQPGCSMLQSHAQRGHVEVDDCTLACL